LIYLTANTGTDSTGTGTPQLPEKNRHADLMTAQNTANILETLTKYTLGISMM
jgi:hypothetical protein